MKSVVVIGAGASGLPAIKSCLEEGLQVLCYEVASDLGGLWRYTDHVAEQTSSVFNSVVLNVNKEMMAYSDYPPPLTFPTYPRHFQWLEYLESYADHFDLRKYIRFNHRVLSVLKSEDYELTGRWRVDVSVGGGPVNSHFFDFVMVCSGHHIYPHVPEFPDQDQFQGKIVHSKVYRNPESFRGKRVVIVGYGNSALDIANDICSATKQTYLSTRRKGWIIPRVLEGRKLTINELYRRSFTLPYSFLPDSWLDRKEEDLFNDVFDHDWIAVRPAHGIEAQRPVINDFFPLHLLYGTIQLRPGIKCFSSNGVIFEGEESVTQADVILLATGFKSHFPFLTGMEDANQYMDKMYQRILPAHLAHHTLAFIGLIDPDYSVPACAEMQSRWTVAVFKEELKLPSRRRMLDDAKRVQDDLKQTTYDGFSQKTKLRAPPYLEQLARELGVRPNLLKLLVCDFELFRGVFFGPLLPYQYRIAGSHSWQGARAAILAAEQRDVYNLTKSLGRKGRRKCNRKSLLLVLGLLLAGVAISKNNLHRKYSNTILTWFLQIPKLGSLSQ